MTDFRKTKRDWCATCESGEKPDAQCKRCGVDKIKQTATGHLIGQPGEYRPAPAPVLTR